LALGVGGVSLLVGVGFVAYSAGRSNSEGDRAAPIAPVVTSPPAVAPPSAPPLPAPPAPSASAPADADEEHLTAQHSPEFPFALDFHFARVRGESSYDLHGQLAHRDGHYFELAPGDSLTLEAGDGLQVMADGSETTPDIEVEVHPHDRSAREYAVDVSFEHRDTAEGWIPLGQGPEHRWDIDHVQQTAVRYVRIRNIDPANSVYLDGVYVRTVQSCTDLSRCRDVNHLAGARRGARAVAAPP
jgi:hypothetical protein